ncbi:class I SAM-dependent methyltransferase [Amylibacter sp. SFDW26]|uniref:SAM-dependent methyltransferase n=1 Tax=Amylibacter sp. SFDW26 TaxID=2652722 RepID=UPI00126164B1|nr:cyclopropane-fatty-acyl-phospholipid synthase family protein [Amylibacter sp. SFDW26]KAB7616140.1 class I SAM-dependent methyltransferase [Amylibacter sp. SFDW26]
MTILTSTKGQENLPRYFALVFHSLKSLKRGALELELTDGRVFRIDGPDAGHVARVVSKDDTIWARLIREGDMGFSDAYLDLQWSSPDLMAFMDLVFDNYHEIGNSYPGAGLLRVYERFRHWMNRNTKNQARKNISYHYDLGNDFYSKWLDDTMTYSSALFKTEQESLEKAQTQKYASICDLMGMQDGDHLLEIGCGWGGFAEYAAGQRGARLKCLTISKEQHDFAKERLFKAGLAERVDVVMQDYRDEKGQYDGIASIEMFEAVGEKYWPSYFDTINNSLKYGKQATIQVITIADSIFGSYRKSVDFIQKHIFPGGMLPSPTVLRQEIERAGLFYEGSMEFGKSYSLTLRRWYEDFNQKWGQISDHSFDDRFRNMWNFYLTSCAAGFEYGTTDVTQVTMRKE